MSVPVIRVKKGALLRRGETYLRVTHTSKLANKVWCQVREGSPGRFTEGCQEFELDQICKGYTEIEPGRQR